jgi:hypothetical protein
VKRALLPEEARTGAAAGEKLGLGLGALARSELSVDPRDRAAEGRQAGDGGDLGEDRR